MSVDLLHRRGVEDQRQGLTTRHLSIVLREDCDIIATITSLLRGQAQCLEELGILRVVRQRLQNVTLLNLQHYVHTALQVQTQVDLLLLTIFVSVVYDSQAVNGQVLDRVKILLFHFVLQLSGISSSILSCLLLNSACRERERELVNTGNRQKDCQ